MAIEIYNNFNLNAAKPIEKRFEYTKVTDAIASGYEYPDGAIHYFTADSTNYPKGLYKYESGAWTLIKQGEDLPENVAYIDKETTAGGLAYAVYGVSESTPKGEAFQWLGLPNVNFLTTSAELLASGMVDSNGVIKIEYDVLNTRTNGAMRIPSANELEALENLDWTFDADNNIFKSGEYSIPCNFSTSTVAFLYCNKIDLSQTSPHGKILRLSYEGGSVSAAIRDGVDYSLNYFLPYKIGTESYSIADKDGGKALTLPSMGIAVAESVTNDTTKIPTSKAVKDYVDAHGGGGTGTTNYNELTNKPLVNESNGDVSASGDLVLNKGSEDEVTVGAKLVELEQVSSTGITTPSGNPMHNVYLKLGCVWNATTQFWELNGLTDITNDEMDIIFAEMDNSPYPSGKANSIKGRTYICNFASQVTYYTASNMFRSCNNIEVIRIGSNVFSYFFVSSLVGIFDHLPKLKKILSIIRVNQCTTTSKFSFSFKSCPLLSYLRLEQLLVSIDLSELPSLDNDSILFMLIKAINTTAITITLHADAYARAIADESIVAKAQEKNITLASA